LETDSRLWSVAQLTGTSNVASNVETVCGLVGRAASNGVELVAFPENATFMGRETEKPGAAESIDGPSVSAVANAAAKHGVFVLLGSFVEASSDPARPFNTSVLIGPDGSRIAAYRKIHLFDCEVSGDRSYKESDFVSGGESNPVTAEVNGVGIGLSICFYLRFPWLYRALVDAGAVALFVPAAFTVPTGRDHWRTLLRARAIETQSFVLAPAQYGTHDTGRNTYGRSMIIDPWGTVLATVPDGGTLALAELRFDEVPAVRKRMVMRTRQL